MVAIMACNRQMAPSRAGGRAIPGPVARCLRPGCRVGSRPGSSRRRVPMIRSQIAFARGACGGLARILVPTAVNTASKEPVNWPARWTPAARVVPLARDQPTVPGEQRRRGHRKHLTPPAARDQSRQRRQPQPVGWLVADPADLAAQDRILVPQHQELGVLGRPVPRQRRQTAEQAAYEQVHSRNDHSAMIPAGTSAEARSSNRAPQARTVSA